MAESNENAVKVIIETSKGSITVELNAEKAPVTVENFLAYVKADFFSETIFHRVIKGFMIQGGGMIADMSPKATSAPIKNEADNGLKNVRGSLAMARTNDPDSATAQFFINTVDNDFLNKGVRDAGYAVFGNVVDGMDIVDTIEAVATRPGDVPTETILINSITIIE
ncbi:MAG: peptidylprolyl isomerase [Anaerohalosphaeraceae bacterium]|nr:peptidylprolyl isomerase [Anaerohalosphaeraceae bacterium]